MCIHLTRTPFGKSELEISTSAATPLTADCTVLVSFIILLTHNIITINCKIVVYKLILVICHGPVATTFFKASLCPWLSMSPIMTIRYQLWCTTVVGCISRVLINGMEMDFAADSLQLTGVDDCPSCQDRPCRNGGTCQSATTKTGYECQCAEGYSGLNCELIGTSCMPGNCHVLLNATCFMYCRNEFLRQPKSCLKICHLKIVGDYVARSL